MRSLDEALNSLDIKAKVKELLDKGLVAKHYTYEETGIVHGYCILISGNAGKDVNHFYIDPREDSDKQIEVCCENSHYGYAYFDDTGHICDNSNRSVFEIVKKSV